MNFFLLAFENQSLRLIITDKEVCFKLPKSYLSPCQVDLIKYTIHDLGLKFVSLDKSSSFITSAFDCPETT
jgi:hypothetical protein